MGVGSETGKPADGMPLKQILKNTGPGYKPGAKIAFNKDRDRLTKLTTIIRRDPLIRLNQKDRDALKCL